MLTIHSYLDHHRDAHLALPSIIIPSLSIVVGLMLVFRNNNSYDRFWSGRNHLTTIVTCVRNLTRAILVNSAPFHCDEGGDERQNEIERQDTEAIVRILMALLYAVKHNLRSEWRNSAAPTQESSRASIFGTLPFHSSSPAVPPSHQRHHSRNVSSSGLRRLKLFGNGSGVSIFQDAGLLRSYTNDQRQQHPEQTANGVGPSAHQPGSNASSGASGLSTSTPTPSTQPAGANGGAAQPFFDYGGLLPSNLGDFEDQGLSLPIQLAVLVESYIHRQQKLNRLTAPQAASQLAPQLNTLTDAFARMETIRTTPLPLAHLIHTKQVLTLYLVLLPFTMVKELEWVAVGVVALVAFTLHGIEAIGRQLEDPFGYDRNDLKMDGIVEDVRVEGMVLLGEWRRGGEMFGS